jgi:hypothetical protein
MMTMLLFCTDVASVLGCRRLTTVFIALTAQSTIGALVGLYRAALCPHKDRIRDARLLQHR